MQREVIIWASISLITCQAPKIVSNVFPIHKEHNSVFSLLGRLVGSQPKPNRSAVNVRGQKHTHLTPSSNCCHWAPVFVKELWPDHRHGTRCNATDKRKEHQNWDAGLFQRVCICEHVRSAERIRDLGISYSLLSRTNTPPAACCSSNRTAVVYVFG